jgi:formate hydrogenlyase transcriptional activator
MVGKCDTLMSVLHDAEKVASTDATVLILGETGTGKELLARHIHRSSRRAAEPFITTNIAAIPATLLESELFGRERGAYTGSMSRQLGRFEVADGGTLFLDEIGELPLETQVKLLRVLEAGSFERLGSSKTLRVNVRVIAATNRKLPELLGAGVFRHDLFYRLNVFSLTMPPLRERVEDIPSLVWAFIREFSYKMGKPIERVRDADVLALQRHRWTGNVRELRNVVERGMILATGSELCLTVPSADTSGDSQGARSLLLRDVERTHVTKILKSTGGRIRGKGGAAEILGLKPTTLYSLMQRLGVERSS